MKIKHPQAGVSARMLKIELDNARIIAGLEDVEGPGIIIKLMI